MGRFLLLLAFLLLGLAIFLLVILVHGGENEWANLIFKTALCKENEELVQWTGNYIPRSSSSSTGGYETAFYCEDSEGEQRDVTLETVGIMMGGFVIPFISALILFFVAAAVMTTNRMKSATKNVFDLAGGSPTWNTLTQQQGQMTVIDLRDGSYQAGEIPPEKLAQVQQIMNSFGLPNFFEAAGGNTLTERLQQLEDARREGLITTEEHQRLRQEILDNLDNEN
jgi:hypothetical protein